MKKLMALASATLLTVAVAAPVAAAPSENASCNAQWIHWVKEDTGERSFKKAVATYGYSVKEAKAIIKGLCDLDIYP